MFFRNIIPIVLILSTFFSCTPIKKLYVPFSEAKLKYAELKDDVIRIYFDRFGFLYPDLNIPYSDFINSYGLLINYYNNNPTVYNTLCTQYKVPTSGKNVNKLGSYEDPLQAALLKKYTDDINKSSEHKELVFIIHGFNEYPLNARDSSSFEEMKVTREIIKKQFKEKKIQFVEIYWDGLSHEGGLKILRSPNSLKIWNNSQSSAMNTGLELRRLLVGISNQKINVITHSHGAGVITAALFNVRKFDEDRKVFSTEFTEEIDLKYKMKIYDCATQEFHVGMLAPAIPGENVFDEYFQRTISGVDSLTTKKNLHFILGFNENDPITLKFKIAAKKLGSTTLGCKPRELLRTENLYKDRTIIDHVDFSTLSNGLPQSDHGWFFYLRNQPSMTNFLGMLIK